MKNACCPKRNILGISVFHYPSNLFGMSIGASARFSNFLVYIAHFNREFHQETTITTTALKLFTHTQISHSHSLALTFFYVLHTCREKITSSYTVIKKAMFLSYKERILYYINSRQPN